jgi:hypothetical protein
MGTVEGPDMPTTAERRTDGLAERVSIIDHATSSWKVRPSS